MTWMPSACPSREPCLRPLAEASLAVSRPSRHVKTLRKEQPRARRARVVVNDATHTSWRGAATTRLVAAVKCRLTRAPLAQVVSNKMMKTVSVAVQRIFRDNHLQRTVRETKKYLVRLLQSRTCADKS